MCGSEIISPYLSGYMNLCAGECMGVYVLGMYMHDFVLRVRELRFACNYAWMCMSMYFNSCKCLYICIYKYV